jgi:hypothetical protein
MVSPLLWVNASSRLYPQLSERQKGRVACFVEAVPERWMQAINDDHQAVKNE